VREGLTLVPAGTTLYLQLRLDAGNVLFARYEVGLQPHGLLCLGVVEGPRIGCCPPRPPLCPT
jgi:hypothetical protein